GANWGEGIAAIQLDNGKHELAVGAPTDQSIGTNGGAVYIYTIDVTATDGTGDFTITDTGTAFYGGTDFNGNGVGQSVVAADVFGHGDGRTDLIYGAYLDDRTNVQGAALEFGDV